MYLSRSAFGPLSLIAIQASQSAQQHATQRQVFHATLAKKSGLVYRQGQERGCNEGP